MNKQSITGLDPDDLREKAKAQAKHLVQRLQDELDEMIKIAAHMREAYHNELMDGLGYKKMGVTPEMVRKGKELATMFDTLTSAKIRFDKSLKQLAETMTPEEERAAVKTYIRSLSVEDRHTLMKDIRDWMKKRNEDISSAVQS